MRLALLLAVLVSASPAAAQRSAWSPPVTLAVVPWAGTAAAPRPYRYVVALSATSEVEVIADARLLRFEVTVPGRRRPHRCEMAGRPRRADTSRARTLASGERWAEWIDLREYCWGNALEALRVEGATLRATYEVARGRRAWIARLADESESSRSIEAVDVVVPTAPTSVAAAEGAARVTLSPADARSGAPSLRVAVYGGETTRRAWIRPDRFRFRVVDPEGGVWVCDLPRTGGTPIPDLFTRISARRAARYSLAGGDYCGEDVFDGAGVYEVTPILDLDEDGAAWELDAIVGTFEGTPVPVRVRGDRGDREVPADVLRSLVR